MKAEKTLSHEFVEYIPDQLKDGVIYVSINFATVAHKCCCGCGKEVVTPLSPTDWKLTYDGQSITIDPSIGNWSFACQSHYWIQRNKVKWAQQWTPAEIKAGRKYDAYAKEAYFEKSKAAPQADAQQMDERKGVENPRESLWKRIIKRLF
jgi:hypothetical protein